MGMERDQDGDRNRRRRRDIDEGNGDRSWRANKANPGYGGYASGSGHGGSGEGRARYSDDDRSYGGGRPSYDVDQRGSGERGSGDRHDPWGDERERHSGESSMGDRMAGKSEINRGKGPKNYTRSDDRIREDVCDALSDDGVVDASDIDIKVMAGEVTLDGTVASREQRRRAEDCLERCSGVRHIQNNLRVRSAEASGAAGSGGSPS